MKKLALFLSITVCMSVFKHNMMSPIYVDSGASVCSCCQGLLMFPSLLLLFIYCPAISS